MGGQCSTRIAVAPGQVNSTWSGACHWWSVMQQTKICSQVLFIVDRLGRLDESERRRLMRESERIARKRRSHVLGVRHVLEAAARILPGGGPE